MRQLVVEAEESAARAMHQLSEVKSQFENDMSIVRDQCSETLCDDERLHSPWRRCNHWSAHPRTSGRHFDWRHKNRFHDPISFHDHSADVIRQSSPRSRAVDIVPVRQAIEKNRVSGIGTVGTDRFSRFCNDTCEVPPASLSSAAIERARVRDIGRQAAQWREDLLSAPKSPWGRRRQRRPWLSDDSDSL